MLLALQVIDLGLAALFVAVLLAVSLFFIGARASNSGDFLLAQRRLAWPMLGLGLVTGLISSEETFALVGMAYRAGVNCLIWPLSLLIVIVFVWIAILPLFSRLQLGSPLEYLELRFSARVRAMALALCIVWQLAIFVGLLSTAGFVLVRDAGLSQAGFLAVLLFGFLATLSAVGGGQAGATWNAAIRTLVFAASVICTAMVLAGSFPGGSKQLAEMATKFGRHDWGLNPVAQGWRSHWFWLALHLVLGYVTMHVANPAMTQRFLSTRSLADSRWALSLYGLVGVSLLAALVYLGDGVLGFYQSRPKELRPIWIANLDHSTRMPVLSPTTGEPLLQWVADGDALDAATFDRARFERLVLEGRLLHPNSGEVWTKSHELLSDDERTIINERLMLRDPRSGEIAVNPQAPRAMLPKFLVGERPLIVGGLLLSLLVAVSLAAADAVLLALGLLLTVDGLGRFRLLRGFVAKTFGRADGKLLASDEVAFARLAMTLVGLTATLFAAFAWRLAPQMWRLAEIANACGGALAAVFLLGLLSRRTGPVAALAALASGIIAAVLLGTASWLPIDVAAPPLLGAFGVAFAMGGLATLVTRQPKPKDALRGLVWGWGELGIQPKNMLAPVVQAPKKVAPAAPPAAGRPAAARPTAVQPAQSAAPPATSSSPSNSAAPPAPPKPAAPSKPATAPAKPPLLPAKPAVPAKPPAPPKSNPSPPRGTDPPRSEPPKTEPPSKPWK